LLKEARGESLTRADAEAVNYYRRHQITELRPEILASIPKGIYCELSGRKHKVIDDQADRYRLPIGGPVVDLFDAVAAFHDFLADHARDLMVDGDGDLKAEKLRKEIAVLERRAKILDGEIRQQRSQWIAKSDVHSRLRWMVGRLQKMAEEIGKMAGADAQRFINDWLEEMAVEMEGGRLNVGEGEE